MTNLSRPDNPGGSRMTPSGIFITGSDTGVGKTFVGVRLTRRLFQQGVDVQPRKPVETGCRLSGNDLIPADAAAYYHAIDKSGNLSAICPWRYRLAASPAEAARRENRPLTLQNLIDACAGNDASFRVVEGAGGFYSPIASDKALNADLAEALGLETLLVVADRLGAINQTLLAAEAIAGRGLTLKGVVLNQLSPTREALNNAEALREHLDCPVLTLGRPALEAEWQAVFSAILGEGGNPSQQQESLPLRRPDKP